MLWVIRAVVFAVLLSSTVVAHGQEAFPPIGDRYKDLPSDAKDVVKALKKLQARTEIGVNFVDYDRAVSDIYPDVKVFIESAEARNLPELQFAMKNAMDCYLKVRELLAVSISSDSPGKQYDASMLLVRAQPTLWKIAAVNISAAHAFVEGPQQDLVKTQEILSAGLGKLTVEAGLAIAEAELCVLDRQSRAEASGVAVPPPDPSEENRDLVAIIYSDGEFGDSVTAGTLEKRLPPIYSKVPPALQEGLIPLLAGGKTCGGVAGFIYSDTKVAKQAVAALVDGFGKNKQRIKGLGDAALGVEIEGLKNVDLVFRRGPMVVFLRSPSASLANSVAIAQNIDKRVCGLFPAAASGDDETDEMVMEEGQTKTLSESDSSDNPLAGLLFQDGDYGKAISGGEFKTTTDEFARLSMNVSAKGSVLLSGNGGVVGFVLENESDAKKAYEAIAEQIGRDGKIAVGLGETSWASRAPVNERMDVVFRRDVFVIYVRVKSKSLAEVTKRVKSVDSRIRKHLAAGDAE